MCPVYIQYLKKNIRLYGVQNVISMANCFCQEFIYRLNRVTGFFPNGLYHLAGILLQLYAWQGNQNKVKGHPNASKCLISQLLHSVPNAQRCRVWWELGGQRRAAHALAVIKLTHIAGLDLCYVTPCYQCA